jgi:hypothetical protein
MEKPMMKRMAMFFVCVSAGFAGYSDGFITAGEYEYAVRWSNYQTPLIVDGGGADQISVRDNGRLIVKSTSKPLSAYHPVGGVYDILLYNTAHLLYLDGVTELIRITGNGTINSTAELRGGSINWINSMQYTATLGLGPHIDLYCQPGWSWLDGDPMKGIKGNWMDGSPFEIKFSNDPTYDPVWTNINVIIPEPATLMLLGIGGILLRRKALR